MIANAEVLAENYTTHQLYHQIYSPGKGVYVYQIVSPPPEVDLSLGIALVDIDSKFLTLNLTLSGLFANTMTYTDTNWDSTTLSTLPPFNNTAGISLWYTSNHFYTSGYYSQGDPKLFPFDWYNYTFIITLPEENLKLNSVDISNYAANFYGQQNLPPGIVIPNVVEAIGNYTQEIDLKGWTYTSAAMYIPPKNLSSFPEVVVNIYLAHRSTDVTNVLVIPVFAMYALLGGSIILPKRKDLTNRIAIYLTVVVFSFGFFTGIRTLTAVPVVIGLTMIERLTLALVPATVSLAIFSMIGNRFRKLRIPLDLAGLIVAFGFMYLLTQFTDTFYYYPLPYRVETFDFLTLGVWSDYLVLVLLIGFFFSVSVAILEKLRHHSAYDWNPP